MQRSPLGGLPAEVRNEIYQLVLGDGASPINVKGGGARTAPPALTQVCRELREEVLPLHLSGKIVRFWIWGWHSFDALWSWLWFCGAGGRAALTRLHLVWPTPVEFLSAPTETEQIDLFKGICRGLVEARVAEKVEWVGPFEQEDGSFLWNTQKLGLYIAGELFERVKEED